MRELWIACYGVLAHPIIGTPLPYAIYKPDVQRLEDGRPDYPEGISIHLSRDLAYAVAKERYIAAGGELEPVIFRHWRGANEDYGTVAIFPCEPADYEGRYTSSFQHIGQHSGCSFENIWNNSTACDDMALQRELEDDFGYVLEVVKSRTIEHKKKFLQRLKDLVK